MDVREERTMTIGPRKKDVMGNGSNSSLKTVLSTSSNESRVIIPMPPAVREQVVELLAKILVEDYELFQVVTWPTVKSPPVFNRRLKLVPPGEKAGYSS